MEYLGIDRDLGAIYEGHYNFGYRVLPPPLLVPIRFFDGGSVPAIECGVTGLPKWIFREDDFDPVTKLRKGRVFRTDGNIKGWQVYDPFRPDQRAEGISKPSYQQVRVASYERDILDNLKNLPSHSFPAVILGWEPHITYWKIISIECNIVGTPVLSLRAKHSLGDIPELIDGNIPPESLKPLTEALNKVEASVNRLSPIEVIDRCRDLLSLAFSHKAGNKNKDLADAIKAYQKSISTGGSPQENLSIWAGLIVARLHARGKPNEQADKKLRPPVESDADLALECMKTVLIEFGWAR
jgi:hypothetical protein